MKKISENGYSLFLTRLSYMVHFRFRKPLSTVEKVEKLVLEKNYEEALNLTLYKDL
jgi:hypothetical protein